MSRSILLTVALAAFVQSGCETTKAKECRELHDGMKINADTVASVRNAHINPAKLTADLLDSIRAGYERFRGRGKDPQVVALAERYIELLRRGAAYYRDLEAKQPPTRSLDWTAEERRLMTELERYCGL